MGALTAASLVAVSIIRMDEASMIARSACRALGSGMTDGKDEYGNKCPAAHGTCSIAKV
jgi:hypothetical protein